MIEDLMNHQVRIWRPTATDGALGGTVTSLGTTPVADTIARVTEFSPPGAFNRGPGEQVIGLRQISMPAGTDVQFRDVIEVYGGPESPVNVRCNTEPSRVSGMSDEHHVKVVCEPWNGTTPEVS